MMDTFSFLIVIYYAIFRHAMGSAATCSNSEFMCGNGNCVTRDFLCDYEDDCGDWTDEHGCQSSACGNNEFMCAASRNCIPHRFKCDGNKDCRDESDEQNCPGIGPNKKPTVPPLQCNVSEWMCVDQKLCIDRKWICDAAVDCKDGSDEADCDSCDDPGHPQKGRRLNNNTGHGELMFLACDDGYELKDVIAIQCLNGQWNHKMPNCTAVHCGDPGTPRSGTKLKDVGSFYYKGYIEFGCKANFILVGAKVITCKANKRWSDKVPVCEAPRAPTCPPSEFTCTNSACVDTKLRCNNKDDCGDNSDEIGCGPSCPVSDFLCDNGRCVTLGVKCDSFDDCGDRSDERGCSKKP